MPGWLEAINAVTGVLTSVGTIIGWLLGRRFTIHEFRNEPQVSIPYDTGRTYTFRFPRPFWRTPYFTIRRTAGYVDFEYEVFPDRFVIRTLSGRSEGDGTSQVRFEWTARGQFKILP